MPTPTLLQRLKERKLVQRALAYLAGAFVVFQLLDALETPLGLTATLQQAILLIIGIGFFITLILAWYHGEKGRQRVSGPELLMVAALLVVAGVALTLLGPQEEGSSPVSLEGDDRPGIAVFPCENWSPDPDDAYFASGIHDEILLHLQKISALRSIGRESMEWYKAHPQPMRQIAQELDVGFLGECSVLKDVDGNRIRLTFQLLDGNTGAQVWAERYDEDLSARSIFDIHTDVARRVARAVGAVLTPEEQERVAGRPTENLEAYTAYLRGRFWWNRRDESAIRRAIGYFEDAIEADSRFAAAYVGLADSYNQLGAYSYMPPQDAFPAGIEAANRALEIDVSLADAYTALGYADRRYNRDFQSARRNFQRALEIDPNSAMCTLWYGAMLRDLGEIDEALLLGERALELDPLSLVINRGWGRTLHVAGRHVAAIEQLERTLQMDPGFIPARATLGLVLIQVGRYQEAIEEFEEVVMLSDSATSWVAHLAFAQANAGEEPEALGTLQWLLNGEAGKWVDPLYIGMIYVGLGDLDHAFEWLVEAVDARSPRLHEVIAHPEWEAIRSDPRYGDLLSRMDWQGPP